MLFESTTLVLRGIVNSLETAAETAWDDYLEYGRQCAYELAQMSRSSSRAYQARGSNPKFNAALPEFERAARAIPHVKLMNVAVRNKDRVAALQNGRAAVAEMDGKITSTPMPATGSARPSDRDEAYDLPKRNTTVRKRAAEKQKPKSKRNVSRV